MSIELGSQATTEEVPGDVTADPSRSRRRWGVIGLCLVAGAAVGMAATIGVWALAGGSKGSLTGAAAEIPSLAQPQQHADILPTLSGLDMASIVNGSSRLAGQTPEASYYLLRSTDGRLCLLILPADPAQHWVEGCSKALPLGVSAAGAGSARVIPSDEAVPPGTFRMGLNVVVDPNSTSLTN